MLTSLLKTVVDSLTEHEKAKIMIRVIQKCPRETAQILAPMLGFEYSSYARMLMSYKTKRELQDVIEKAQVEGPLSIFAKAALAVHKSDEEADLREAREMTRRL